MFSGCDFRAVAAGNCCRSASPGVARIFFQSLSFVLGGGIDSLDQPAASGVKNEGKASGLRTPPPLRHFVWSRSLGQHLLTLKEIPEFLPFDSRSNRTALGSGDGQSALGGRTFASPNHSF